MKRTQIACLLALTLSACDGTSMTPMDSGAPPADASTPDAGAPSADAGQPDAGRGDGGTPRQPDYLTPGDPIEVGVGCVPPPLLELADIPEDPSLADDDEDVLAVFEVDGDALVGKWVRDPEAARAGLAMWREVVLRIPVNQRLDLVQLDIFTGRSQAAYFNRTGDIRTDRYGLKIGFHLDTYYDNQPDICAPLEPRRGSFDWSLVHEFGHLRGWLDGSWDAFLDRFDDVRGSGEGYPDDGSPVLDRDFVTSYAERADGDEDHAESWTTFVMIDLARLPAPTPDEPLAVTKVRWMSEQPDLLELRRALRITEPDGGDVTIVPAPRLFASRFPRLSPPARLLGRWEGEVEARGGEPAYVQRFDIGVDDVRASRWVDGVEVEGTSLLELHRGGAFVRVNDSDEGELYFYAAQIFGIGSRVDNFLTEGLPDGELVWSRDLGPSDVAMRRVD